MNTLTLINAPDMRLEIAPNALKRKADALDLAKSIQAVKSCAQQQDAIASASLMKGLVKGIEKAHAEAKRPIIDAGNMVDAAKKSYAKELHTEILRVESLAADFQREENRKAEAARLAEIERQTKERESAATDKAREQRFMAEKDTANDAERMADLERIAQATSDEEREAARKIADDNAEARSEEQRILQQAITDAEEQRQEEARARAVSLSAVSAAPKAEGASVMTGYDYTVTDIHALYRSRPDLVVIEPQRSLILAAIANGRGLPGIAIHETVKVHSKASL